MIATIWDVNISEEEEETDLTPYFDRVERLGFGSKAGYEKDMEDPRWLDNDEDG